MNLDDITQEIEAAKRLKHRVNGIYYSLHSSYHEGAVVLYPALGTPVEEVAAAIESLRVTRKLEVSRVVEVPPEVVVDEAGTSCDTEEEKMGAIRAIMMERSVKNVEGVPLDVFSASAVIAVYDTLTGDNKTAFASRPVPEMVTMALKLSSTRR